MSADLVRGLERLYDSLDDAITDRERLLQAAVRLAGWNGIITALKESATVGQQGSGIA